MACFQTDSNHILTIGGFNGEISKECVLYKIDDAGVPTVESKHELEDPDTFTGYTVFNQKKNGLIYFVGTAWTHTLNLKDMVFKTVKRQE